jgi:hypothetical protein
MNAAYTSLGRNNVGHVIVFHRHAYGADGSCRSGGRQERAHRSLENPRSGFPTAPTGHHHSCDQTPEATAETCTFANAD